MEMIIHRKGEAFTVLYDECDHDLISKHSWSINRIYAKTKFKGKTILMHRLILSAKQGEIVDHKNHNGLDNRRSNIRICNRFENARNRRSFGNSQYLGVHFVAAKQLFKAAIKASGTQMHLGYFIEEAEAALAYDRAARYFYGEFANLNFIDQIDEAFDASEYFKQGPMLDIGLPEILTTKEYIKNNLEMGDMRLASKKLGKSPGFISNWLAVKKATKFDYQNFVAIMEVVAERQKKRIGNTEKDFLEEKAFWVKKMKRGDFSEAMQIAGIAKSAFRAWRLKNGFCKADVDKRNLEAIKEAVRKRDANLAAALAA